MTADDKRIHDLAIHAMSLPRTGLGDFYESLSAGDAARVNSLLSSYAQAAAQAEGYFSARTSGATDERAESYCIRRLRQVRRAMGFTHP